MKTETEVKRTPNKYLEPGQKPDETPMEYLRRLVSNCDMETESILDTLPSVQAILEFFGLWEIYDTDLLQGIHECIEDGDDPKPYLDFVKRWDLDWFIDFERQSEDIAQAERK